MLAVCEKINEKMYQIIILMIMSISRWILRSFSLKQEEQIAYSLCRGWVYLHDKSDISFCFTLNKCTLLIQVCILYVEYKCSFYQSHSPFP